VGVGIGVAKVFGPEHLQVDPMGRRYSCFRQL
jgi:hypothetical protein